MKMKTILPVSTAVLTLLLFFISCSKNSNTERGQARLQVYLTDDPGDYEEVLIDVQDVQVNVTGTDDAGWQSLEGVSPGVYDLLKLVNDEDTLLADAVLPAGRLHQMRLVLGPNNYVKLGGSLLQLNTPSAQQSGLKLNVQQDLTAGLLYKIVLDFDVAKSIVATGSGAYNLKPLIRTVFESVGGSIRGWVDPKDFRTGVAAIQGTDTVAGTFTGIDGGYVVKGLAEGTYSLYFDPSVTTHKDSLLENVEVVNKQVTLVDTMYLQP
jgi:hypothetical protein